MKDEQGDVTEFMRRGGQEVGSLDAPRLPQVGKEVAAMLTAVADRVLVWTNSSANMTPDEKLVCLRARLLVEETLETIEGLAKNDLVGVADGLVDLLYVTIGAAVSFGIDLQPLWDEVHRSNLAKFTQREDGSWGRYIDAGGKVTKPPGWTPPDIAGVLARQPGDRRWTNACPDCSDHPDYDSSACSTCRGTGWIVTETKSEGL